MIIKLTDMENQSIAPSATWSQRWDLFKDLLLSLLTNRPNILRQKTRSEIIGKVIEDLSFELTSRDFTNTEITYIINGIARKGKATLEEREKYLSDELTKTKVAIERIVK